MRIGLAWPPGVTSGWGVLALNMTLELIKHPDAHPFLILPPHEEALLDPNRQALLAPLVAEQRELQKALDAQAPKVASLSHPIIHSLTNHCQWGAQVSERVRGRPNLAYIFLEDTNLTDEDRARAAAVDLILAGCSWNEEVLRANGIENVATVTQGVDTTLFRPAPGKNLFPGKFVIFGGGSLGYRKAQDVVAAAFKAFHARHSDAFLLTAWQNPVPASVADIDTAGLMQGAPAALAQGGIDVKGWLVANGIPPDACHDVGAVPNEQTPDILREAHVALFPNRAEGGTNLVAMEAMACGLPCLISDGHGHGDLIGDGNCIILEATGGCTASDRGNLAGAGTDGWTEISVEACVEALEFAYQNRDQATEIGAKGADFMSTWTWARQVDRVVELANTRLQ